MGGKVNNAAWKDLLTENIAWLNSQEKSLERDHIIGIMETLTKAGVDKFHALAGYQGRPLPEQENDK